MNPLILLAAGAALLLVLSTKKSDDNGGNGGNGKAPPPLLPTDECLPLVAQQMIAEAANHPALAAYVDMSPDELLQNMRERNSTSLRLMALTFTLMGPEWASSAQCLARTADELDKITAGDDDSPIGPGDIMI